MRPIEPSVTYVTSNTLRILGSQESGIQLLRTQFDSRMTSIFYLRTWVEEDVRSDLIRTVKYDIQRRKDVEDNVKLLVNTLIYKLTVV